jgi:hypothetical protein
MKQLFMAVVFSGLFAFVGLAGARSGIPPLNLLEENIGTNSGPILFAVIGLGVGFWLGNR